jgi:hypothetical protein
MINNIDCTHLELGRSASFGPPTERPGFGPPRMRSLHLVTPGLFPNRKPSRNGLLETSAILTQRSRLLG